MTLGPEAGTPSSRLLECLDALSAQLPLYNTAKGELVGVDGHSQGSRCIYSPVQNLSWGNETKDQTLAWSAKRNNHPIRNAANGIKCSGCRRPTMR